MVNYRRPKKRTGAGMDSPPPMPLPNARSVSGGERESNGNSSTPTMTGGYTAVMPYFSCHLTTQGNCLTAQGETPDEAMARLEDCWKATWP